jgi:SWI/SNF-related matrix-associated actin-dependent regulator 1 of chromatin subfamily A
MGLGGNGMNLSEMGTGKTIMTLSLLEFVGPCRVVVVCPTSLKTNWMEETTRFTDIKTNVITKKNNSLITGVNVISYGSLHFLSDRVVDIDYLVLDECHYVQNPHAKRSKLVAKLAAQSRRKLLLSGTPMSKTKNLFWLLHLVRPDVFRRFSRVHTHLLPPSETRVLFGERYCAPTKVFIARGRKTIFTYDGTCLPWEVHAILTLFAGKIQKNTDELPPKLRSHVILQGPLTALEHASFLSRIQKLKNDGQVKKAERELSARMIQHNTVKRPCTIKYLKSQADTFRHGGKTLIFAHFKDTLFLIEQFCREEKLPYIKIDGQTPPSTRQDIVNSFQTDQSIKVAVLSIQAAGVGLNLFAASRVVFAELLWSEKDMIQAEDRAHRRGQKATVHVDYLVLEHSIDKLVWSTLRKKVRCASVVVDDSTKDLDISILTTHSSSTKEVT